MSGACNLRILFVGDVVGRAGRTAVSELLPGMVRDWSLDLVVGNGDNSAGGFGITEAIYRELIDAGADAITLGNHAWDQRALIGNAIGCLFMTPFDEPFACINRELDSCRLGEAADAIVVDFHGEA